ncbi:nuclear transport factor 2 family protein [Burkholderia multivorans]|uniref:nuclear transport factor 2 family protein n=1 Tax=Burkholderia multivorans TaxID=87883 RepID=UPI001C2466AD|nr:nuclear transport factor 2 family protein [Burkholderia multivorans]MBU9477692.1 nuclear transport factor 2 family protein [Burkholderia multivorans]
MTNSDSLAFLLDRQAILDCVNRYCIGIDRHDTDLIVSAFHADAVDEHGPYVGGPVGLAKWANDYHSANFSSHTHCITTHHCEIDGDVAHAQTYCLYTLRRTDDTTVMMGCARYVDRLEKRGGVWKIAYRRTLIEWRAEATGNMPAGYQQGKRDKSDIAYERDVPNGSQNRRA